MARKSRKNVMLQENTALPDKEKKVLFKAGLYARLSHEKEENIERGTIETQMELMKNYVKDHEVTGILRLFKGCWEWIREYLRIQMWSIIFQVLQYVQTVVHQ